VNTLTKLLTGILLAGFAAKAPAVADSLRIGYQNEPDPSHVAIVDGVYEKATGGLGFMIKGAADFLVTDVVILGILVIAAAAIVMEIGLRVVQRIVAPWQGRE
jgi:taurine transport system permease protein